MIIFILIIIILIHTSISFIPILFFGSLVKILVKRSRNESLIGISSGNFNLFII